MKQDLFTSIVVFIIGIVAAYFACDFIVPKVENTTIKIVGTSISGSVDEPDPEIFNYLAINPTVDAIVKPTGYDYIVCAEYDDDGNCIIELPEESEPEEEPEEEPTEETPTPIIEGP